MRIKVKEVVNGLWTGKYLVFCFGYDEGSVWYSINSHQTKKLTPDQTVATGAWNVWKNSPTRYQQKD